MRETKGESTLSIILGYDAATLREKVDLKSVGERLDELGSMRSLEALCEKTWLLKVAGQLDDALDAANASIRLARFTGNRRDLMRPRMLRAQVLQFRAEFEPALQELNSLIEEAHTHEWQLYEAFALQHRGKVYFDQGEFQLALADFRSAVQIRRAVGASESQIESSLVAISAAESRVSA